MDGLTLDTLFRLLLMRKRFVLFKMKILAFQYCYRAYSELKMN